MENTKQKRKRKPVSKRWTRRKKVKKTNNKHTVDEYLMSLYSKPGNPGAFGSFSNLWNSVQQAGTMDITKTQAREFLKSILVYTIHCPQSHKYKTQRYFIGIIRQHDQLDLADVGRFKDYNDELHFCLWHSIAFQGSCVCNYSCIRMLRKWWKH